MVRPLPNGIDARDAWEQGAPRDEIRPEFAYEPQAGPGGKPALSIRCENAGGNGYWRKTFTVAAGQFYRFSASFKADHVTTPRRGVLAEIEWQDDQGHTIPTDMGSIEPELPAQGAVRTDGWTEVSDVYRVPRHATRAQVDLVLRWASKAVVEWSAVSLVRTDAPPKRLVRLAAAHLRPENSSGIEENVRLMEALVEEAANDKADLIVFGELITVMGVREPNSAAECVPGRTTALLGEMARKHKIYVVAGLPDRDGKLLYNTAVLVGPDGELVGKYRKVALTDREARDGFTPGAEYPVFSTRFGKLGIIICYDLFFPEVAQRVATRGAEIIAVPIWGGDESIAHTRALDTRVFLITSTYEPPWLHWMRSGICDREGNRIAAAKDYGTVAFAEVDLNERFDHKWVGDFRNHIPH